MYKLQSAGHSKNETLNFMVLFVSSLPLAKTKNICENKFL